MAAPSPVVVRGLAQTLIENSVEGVTLAGISLDRAQPNTFRQRKEVIQQPAFEVGRYFLVDPNVRDGSFSFPLVIDDHLWRLPSRRAQQLNALVETQLANKENGCDGRT